MDPLAQLKLALADRYRMDRELGVGRKDGFLVLEPGTSKLRPAGSGR